MRPKRSKRVAFTFDERSLSALQDMTEAGKFGSIGDAMRESLQISQALQAQAKNGYVEVIVRNPKTGEERVILIPSLQILGGE